jgi:hypothetical protein
MAIELSLPLPVFIECIDAPLPSYEEWENCSLDLILTKTKNSHFTDKEIRTTTSEVYNELLNYSGIFGRIKAAKRLLKGMEEHQFLKDFSKQSAPLQFWSKYRSLGKKAPDKRELLDHIMGEQGLKIARECCRGKGQVMQMKIQLQIKILFIQHIEAPLPSYKEWEDRSLKLILTKTKNSEFTNKEVRATTSEVYHELINCSGILDRIKGAEELFTGREELLFLKDFSRESAPLQFWSKYRSLGKTAPDKRELLDHIMGEQAPKIIQECSHGKGHVMQMKIQSQIKTIAAVKIEKSKIEDSSFKLGKKFDCDNLHIVPDPIFILNYKEFDDSFSRYYLDGPFEEYAIKINGENFAIPDYNDLKISQENRRRYFQEELVSKIQEKLGITCPISVQDQLKLFSGKEGMELKCNFPKLKKLIADAFAAEFSELKTSGAFVLKLNECFIKLQGDKEGKDFAKHMSPFTEFIGRYLTHHRGYKERDWDAVAELLIDLYQRLHHLGEKLEKIPLLPLLKGMSSPSCVPCKTFLKTTLCPNLFKGEEYSHQIVFNDTDPGGYDVFGHGQFFDVTHIKPFQVMSGKESKLCGKMCWTISGQLHSLDYSSALQIDFDFFPKCLPDEQLQIMRFFNPKCQNCPWGSSYFSRVLNTHALEYSPREAELSPFS